MLNIQSRHEESIARAQALDAERRQSCIRDTEAKSPGLPHDHPKLIAQQLAADGMTQQQSDAWYAHLHSLDAEQLAAWIKLDAMEQVAVRKAFTNKMV